MLTSTKVHTDIASATAVYADTCSFTLTALSPNKNLWDAIPRDIDFLRFAPQNVITSYCESLVQNAREFANEIRSLHLSRRLFVLDQIKTEVQGQRGRANGLHLRASQRFPFAPSELVQASLAFQIEVHDIGLQSLRPLLERRLVDEIMRRLAVF